MTFGAMLGLVSGLALVLGLVALLTRLARGLGVPGAGRGRGGLEVLSRTGLAPRQGIAVVRAEGRRLLLGYGEGGVRMLTELDPHDEAEAVAARRAAVRSNVRVVRDDVDGHDSLEQPATVPGGRLRSLLRGMGVTLAVAGLLALARPAAAQRPVFADSASAAAASAPTAAAGADAAQLLRARLPDLGLQVQTGDGEGLSLSGPVGVVVFMGFLTLLPTLLLLMTSFTRILVVLHFLKQAIGTQTAPPAHLLAALALLLTGFVMAPTLSQANRVAIDPWVRGEMDEATMLKAASVPFREFMLRSTREQDLATFVRLSGAEVAPQTPDDIPLVVLASAFVTSELRAAFQMGFALFLPFVVIDLVVASVLMSMGMFMLPPVMVSLPFKLLLFVLVDGWSLVVESLVRSFG